MVGCRLGAAAVVLNVTVTGAQGSGFVTVFPCGEALPTASNLNFVAGCDGAERGGREGGCGWEGVSVHG